ncbi:MAG: hypothetical protein QM796_15965 [Chthoniobacteraceae bacterium]
MRILSFRYFVISLLVLAGAEKGHAQFLFDATKAEMAGNADWVIDADSHNLNVTNGNGSGTTGTGGSESNPQSVPTPAASGITSSTSETYWTGALGLGREPGEVGPVRLHAALQRQHYLR